MKKLMILIALVFLSGCAVSGARVSARHTIWDGHTPITIEVETDFEFANRRF